MKKDSKNTTKQKRNDLAIKRLVNVFNHSDLERRDMIYVITSFLYSVGSALLDNPPKSHEGVLLRYANDPSFGSALMAQATFMQEAWVTKEIKKEKTNEHDIRRETKSRKSTTAIKDI